MGVRNIMKYYNCTFRNRGMFMKLYENIWD